MRRLFLPVLGLLLSLAACRKEDSSPIASGRGPLGEDARYDCADTALLPAEREQWTWLRRGFRLPDRPTTLPQEDLRLRVLRREPGGVEMLVQWERLGGSSRGLVVRPRGKLHDDFVQASMENGLVAGLWSPKVALDTIALPDTSLQAGLALLSERPLPGWTSMRRCDTSTSAPSELGEALYLLQLESAGSRRLLALRPGHYAEEFWNRLQRLVDRQEKLPPGVGF